jgi:hypothetical protein
MPPFKQDRASSHMALQRKYTWFFEESLVCFIFHVRLWSIVLSCYFHDWYYPDFMVVSQFFQFIISFSSPRVHRQTVHLSSCLLLRG